MYRQNRTPKTSPFTAKGFDEWFVPISTTTRQEHEIFLVDFKTQIFQEEIESNDTPFDGDDFDYEVNQKDFMLLSGSS